MSDMSAELMAAIGELYRVFGHYRLEHPIEVCDQCYPELAGVFAKRPLREIDDRLLCQYVDARACVGYFERMDNELRYMLPRWLELLAAGAEIGRFGDEDGLMAIKSANWRDRWPSEEVVALDRYFAALFREAMRLPVEIVSYRPVSTLGGRDIAWFLWHIGAAGSNAALPLLHIAEDLPGRDMDLRIAGLARELAHEAVQAWSPSPQEPPEGPFDADLAVLSTDEDLGARCDCERCVQRAAAWEWLSKPAFRERLETATLNEANPDAAALLSMGEQLIAALIRNRAERHSG